MTEEEIKANEYWRNSIPKILKLTKEPIWVDLLDYIAVERKAKTKLLELSADWETTRHIQGVIKGLDFLVKLPDVLETKLDEITRDSDEDSQ